MCLVNLFGGHAPQRSDKGKYGYTILPTWEGKLVQSKYMLVKVAWKARGQAERHGTLCTTTHHPTVVRQQLSLVCIAPLSSRRHGPIVTLFLRHPNKQISQPCGAIHPSAGVCVAFTGAASLQAALQISLQKAGLGHCCSTTAPGSIKTCTHFSRAGVVLKQMFFYPVLRIHASKQLSLVACMHSSPCSVHCSHNITACTITVHYVYLRCTDALSILKALPTAAVVYCAMLLPLCPATQVNASKLRKRRNMTDCVVLSSYIYTWNPCIALARHSSGNSNLVGHKSLAAASKRCAAVAHLLLL